MPHIDITSVIFNILTPKSLTYLFYCQGTSSGQCLKHVVNVYLSVLPLASGQNVLRFAQKVPSKSFVKTDDAVCF